MSDELKPCPFCGSDHVVESVGTKAGGEPWPYIECFGCSASAEPDVWNRRADSDDIATLRATIERMSQTALIDTQQIAALNAQVATLTADVAAERLERESHADDAIRLHREKCDCILREMALTAERDKLRTSMDQLRRSCANIIGADEEAWPDHGNAPLAIAACLGLRSAELVQATAERDRYRAALAEIAKYPPIHPIATAVGDIARAALQEPKT